MEPKGILNIHRTFDFVALLGMGKEGGDVVSGEGRYLLEYLLLKEDMLKHYSNVLKVNCLFFDYTDHLFNRTPFITQYQSIVKVLQIWQYMVILIY